jgi:hypothetical protein
MGQPDPRKNLHVDCGAEQPQHADGHQGDSRDLRTASRKSGRTTGAAVALWFTFYNFCRVHRSLRVTPAMEAKITDHVWSVRELPEAA